MNDEKFKYWFGIEREKIDWHPTINYEKCVNCHLCVALCGRGVFAIADGKSTVVNPNNCLVGCTTCGNICPVGAIDFPPKEKAKNYVKVYNIWKKVDKIAQEKTEKILNNYHNAMQNPE